MRAPPPVSALLPDDPAWRALRAFVPALSSLTVMVWLVAWAEGGTVFVLGAFVLAAALAVVIDRRGRLPPLELGWDGTQWWCRTLRLPADAPTVPAAVPPFSWEALGRVSAWRVQPRVRIDLGPWMLLRIDPAEAPSGSDRDAVGGRDDSPQAPADRRAVETAPSVRASPRPSPRGRARRRGTVWRFLESPTAGGCRGRCPRWWALSRRGAGTAWTGLRLALYCAPLGPPPRSDGG